MQSNNFDEPLIPGMVRVRAIEHRYKMPKQIQKEIKSMDSEFGSSIGNVVYLRTYSQLKSNGQKETFPETIIRVIEGIISIEKNHRINNLLVWNEDHWHTMARRFGRSMMKMHFLPPGRGLWISGTEYSYTRGAAAFNNCGFISLKEGLILSACWMMDMLMCGCGIGFDMRYIPEEFNSLRIPTYFERNHVIHDSREGWVESLYILLTSYFTGGSISFDYSRLRKEGERIKGFGGTSSGPEPLRILHERIRIFIECYIRSKTENTFTCIYEMTEKHAEFFSEGKIKSSLLFALASLNEMGDEMREKKTYGPQRLIADIFNSIAACVIAGNVRRSSQIALCNTGIEEFVYLKDFSRNPERGVIAYSSNNSIVLEKTEDFDYLDQIADRIRVNGEPGVLNLINCQKYGRYGRGEPVGREAERDKCTGVNPCGEMAQESGELCNLSEVFPSRCETEEDLLEAVELATLYCSIVSLLQTQWAFSNAIIARNRRIGVSQSGVIDYIEKIGAAKYIKLCRKMYRLVRQVNERHAEECGIPSSIRVTTVKPSGTISNLPGVSPGVHHSLFEYCIRRIRIATDSDISRALIKAKVPWEISNDNGEGTLVFSFPLKMGSKRISAEVSIWEQISFQVLMQREWADNAVSFTANANTEDELNSIEHLLSTNIPVLKGVSILPNYEIPAFKQMPFERISKQEYEKMVEELGNFDLDISEISEFPEGVRGCDSTSCSI